jgi:dCMP deaminase
MKEKHIRARIKMCLALSELSNCPRRKFGALLIDPVRNQVLGEGYNGAPRGGGELCGDHRCLRDGLTEEDVVLEPLNTNDDTTEAYVTVKGKHTPLPDGRYHGWREEAVEYRKQILADNPPIKSGTHMEIGCHHAEMNVVCNAAASTLSTQGAWLIVTGEPCWMCSKMIHHAGIKMVMVVGGGYIGANGVQYLKEHGVAVEVVEGPQDPRLTSE